MICLPPISAWTLICCPMGSPKVASGEGRAKRYLSGTNTLSKKSGGRKTILLLSVSNLQGSIGGYALNLLEREMLPLCRVCEDWFAFCWHFSPVSASRTVKSNSLH